MRKFLRGYCDYPGKLQKMFQVNRGKWEIGSNESGCLLLLTFVFVSILIFCPVFLFSLDWNVIFRRIFRCNVSCDIWLQDWYVGNTEKQNSQRMQSFDLAPIRDQLCARVEECFQNLMKRAIEPVLAPKIGLLLFFLTTNFSFIFAENRCNDPYLLYL